MAVTFPYVRAATWADGSTTDTAARRNTIEDGIFNAHQPPAVRVYKNAAQSIPNNTTTAVQFDTEAFDQAGGASSTQHDTVTNNTRLTCLFAGIYSIIGDVEWGSNVTGRRLTRIRLNGTTDIASEERGPTSSGNVASHISTLYALAVNDYVELTVFQDSGSAVNVAAPVSHYSPAFMMVRVA